MMNSLMGMGSLVVTNWMIDLMQKSLLSSMPQPHIQGPKT